MTQPKQAEVVANEPAGLRGRRLTFQPRDAIAPRGGQFVIVDTAIPIGPDKTLKRAYSIVSSSASTFDVAVEGVGQASRSLHSASVGSVFDFSGPWGHFDAGIEEPNGRALVCATDTAITAAIGLLTGDAFVLAGRQADLVWFTPDTERFLGRRAVEATIADYHVTLHTITATDVGTDARADSLIPHVDELWLENGHAAAWLAGDGYVITPLSENLRLRGVAPERVQSEFFFHKPARS